MSLLLYPPQFTWPDPVQQWLAVGGGAVWGKLKIPPLALGSSIAEGSLELLSLTCIELLARRGVQTARGFP